MLLADIYSRRNLRFNIPKRNHLSHPAFEDCMHFVAIPMEWSAVSVANSVRRFVRHSPLRLIRKKERTERVGQLVTTSTCSNVFTVDSVRSLVPLTRSSLRTSMNTILNRVSPVWSRKLTFSILATDTKRKLRPRVSKIRHIDRKRKTGLLYVSGFYTVLLLRNRVGRVCGNGSHD